MADRDFDVFHEHGPNNLLLKQAYEEVYDFQLEQTRMRNAMDCGYNLNGIPANWVSRPRSLQTNFEQRVSK